MSLFTVVVNHHHHGNPAVEFARVLNLLERIAMTQADLVKEIADAKAEIATKITALSDQLAAALAKQTDVTPELQTAVTDLKSFADGLTPVVTPVVPA